MDPTPFSAALITAGEFSRKSTKDERGESLDCETIILKIYYTSRSRHVASTKHACNMHVD